MKSIVTVLVFALFLSVAIAEVRPAPLFGGKKQATEELKPQAASSPQPKPEMKAVQEKVDAIAEEAHTATHEAPAPEAAEEVAPPKHKAMHKKVDYSSSIAPEKSLGWLKNGNKRFVKQSFRKDGQSIQDVKRLTPKQKPHAIVISCSDSRVPPELIFDQKLGEIFVIRNAGEALDSVSLASIEYAVEHLATRLIVVLGHNSCGAVAAAMMTLGGGTAGSPHLDKLVQDIHPRIQSFQGKKPSQYLEQESWANVKGVAMDLVARSEIIAHAVESGNLQIRSALYHTESGKVDFK